MCASVEKKQERVIYWYHILILSFVHLIFPWSLYILFSKQQFSLFAWVFVLSYSSGIGISVGSHRLWTHRAFKAKLPLRIFLAFLQTKAYQYSIFNWVRDHRMHHKFTDTDADPHNPNRGFFFRHIGWLFVKPHSQILAKRKDIDMSDVWADPVVYYQKKILSSAGNLLRRHYSRIGNLRPIQPVHNRIVSNCIRQSIRIHPTHHPHDQQPRPRVRGETLHSHHNGHGHDPSSSVRNGGWRPQLPPRFSTRLLFQRVGLELERRSYLYRSVPMYRSGVRSK